MQKKISGFFGKYRFLSNYHLIKFFYNGHIFDTAEHAFHYMKVDEAKDLPEDDENSWRYKILHARTPGDAKKLGRQCPMRADWNEKKIEIVKDIVHAKFRQNKGITQLLKETGDAYLEETNDWNDIFWGVCNGVGENHLGKILMEVRDML